MPPLDAPLRERRISSYNSVEEPINIYDSGDDDDIDFDHGHVNRQDAELRQTVRGLVRRRDAFDRPDDMPFPQSPENYIDLDAMLEDGALASNNARYIDLTTADEPPRLAPQRLLFEPARNLPLGASRVELPGYNCSSGFELRPGMFVELSSPVVADLRFKVPLQFLLIKTIVKDISALNYGKVTVRGWPFARTREFGGQLHHKLNELCLLYEMDDDDTRPADEQALLEVDVNSTAFVRRELLRTNITYPDRRGLIFGRDGRCDRQKTEESGLLVCRWRYYIYYRDASKRRQRKPREWALVHAQYEDADPNARILDETRLNIWRGGRIRGGSYLPSNPRRGVPTVTVDDRVVVDLDTNGQPPLQIKQPGQLYTFGDMFCGAGGASRGAEMAGFKVSVAVDHWDAACASYQANFPSSDLHKKSVYDFATAKRHPAHIDVLHLSPPCQVWSPAHTIAGQHDDDNMASLFACHDLIKELQPRLFTLEQTFGILFPAFAPHFNAMIQGFTTLNYSVRWRVVDLDTWGLPQARKRLVMVGACPGEKLPPFPKATHGDGALARLSVHRALSVIGPRTTLHDVSSAARRDLPAWDPSSTLPYTITCSGGQNYHYSGRRDFTLREFACLQGFPVLHQFCAPGIRKQIGNAFPPCVVRVLYDHLRRWLEAEDRVKPAPAGPVALAGLPLVEAATAAPLPRGSGSGSGSGLRRAGAEDSRRSPQPPENDMDVIIIDAPPPLPDARSNTMSPFLPLDDVMYIDGDSDEEDGESTTSSITMMDVDVVDLTVDSIGDDEL